MKIKKMLLFILCITVISSTAVYASPKTPTITSLKKQITSLETQINSYKKQIISLKNQIVDLKNQALTTLPVTYIVDDKLQTKNPEGLLYKGDIYVSLKNVAEMVGKKYTWDRNSKKIYISDTGTIVKPLKEIYLTGYPFIDIGDSNVNSKVVVKNDTDRYTAFQFEFLKNYENNTSLYWSKNYVTYALNGKAKRLKGAISVDGRFNELATVKIYDENDKIIYESPKIIEGMEPYEIDVDVTNLLKVKIEVLMNGTDSSCYTSELSLGNLRVLTSDY